MHDPNLGQTAESLHQFTGSVISEEEPLQASIAKENWTTKPESDIHHKHLLPCNPHKYVYKNACTTNCHCVLQSQIQNPMLLSTLSCSNHVRFCSKACKQPREWTEHVDAFQWAHVPCTLTSTPSELQHMKRFLKFLFLKVRVMLNIGECHPPNWLTV